MDDHQAFGLAMATLGVNCRIEITDEQLKLFWRFCADLSDAEFAQAVAVHLRTSRFFPTVAELRAHVTPRTNPQAEAVLAFEQVCRTAVHTPHGPRWSIRHVAEVVGPIAAEAFAAAGASRAFEGEQGERDLPYLRKRFVDAYVAAAEDLAAGRPVALAITPERIQPTAALVAATAQALQLPKP